MVYFFDIDSKVFRLFKNSRSLYFLISIFHQPSWSSLNIWFHCSSFFVSFKMCTGYTYNFVNRKLENTVHAVWWIWLFLHFISLLFCFPILENLWHNTSFVWFLRPSVHRITLYYGFHYSVIVSDVGLLSLFTFVVVFLQSLCKSIYLM